MPWFTKKKSKDLLKDAERSPLLANSELIDPENNNDNNISNIKITDLPKDILNNIASNLDIKALLALQNTAKFTQVNFASNINLATEKKFKAHIRNEFGNINWEQCRQAVIDTGITNPSAMDIYLFLMENIHKPLIELQNKKNIKKLIKHQRFYNGCFDRENILTVATRLGCHVIVEEVLELYKTNKAKHVYLDDAIRTAIINNETKLLRSYLEKYQEQHPLVIDLQLHDCFELATAMQHKSVFSELVKFKIQRKIPDVLNKKSTLEYIFIHDISSAKLFLSDEMEIITEKTEKTSADTIRLALFLAIKENDFVKVSHIISDPAFNAKNITYLNDSLTALQLAVLLEKPAIIKCILAALEVKTKKVTDFDDEGQDKIVPITKPLLALDPNQQNNFKQTALDLAVMVGNQECIQLLQPIAVDFKEAPKKQTLDLGNVIQGLKDEHDLDFFKTVLKNLDDIDPSYELSASSQELETLFQLIIQGYNRFNREIFSEEVQADDDFFREVALRYVLKLACQNKTNVDWLKDDFLENFSIDEKLEFLFTAIDNRHIKLAKHLLKKLTLAELPTMEREYLVDKILCSGDRQLCRALFEKKEINPWKRSNMPSSLMPIPLEIIGVDFAAFLNVWHKKMCGFGAYYLVGAPYHVDAITAAAKRDDLDEFKKLFAWFGNHYNFQQRTTWLNQFIWDVVSSKSKRIILDLLQDKKTYDNDIFKWMLLLATACPDNEMFDFILSNSLLSFSQIAHFKKDRAFSWSEVLSTALRNKNLHAFKALLKFIGDDIVYFIENPHRSELLLELYKDDPNYLDAFLEHWPVAANPLQISNSRMQSFIENKDFDHLIIILKHYVFTDHPKLCIYGSEDKNALIQTVLAKAICDPNGKQLLEYLFQKITSKELNLDVDAVNLHSKTTLLAAAIQENNSFAVRLLLKHNAKLVGTTANIDYLQLYIEHVQKGLWTSEKEKVLFSLVRAAQRQPNVSSRFKNNLIVLSKLALLGEENSIDKIKQSLPTFGSEQIKLAKLALHSPKHIKTLMECLPQEAKDNILPELGYYCAEQFYQAILNKQFDYVHALLADSNPVRGAIFDHYAAPNSVLSFLLERIYEDDSNRGEYEALIKEIFPMAMLNQEQFLHFNQLLQSANGLTVKSFGNAFNQCMQLLISRPDLFCMMLNPFAYLLNSALIASIPAPELKSALTTESVMNMILEFLRHEGDYPFPSNLIAEYTTTSYYYHYELAKKTSDNQNNINRMLEKLKDPGFDPLLLKHIDSGKAQELFYESIIFLVMRGEPLEINPAIKKYLVNHKEALVTAFDAYFSNLRDKQPQEKLELHRQFYNHEVIKPVIDTQRYNFFKETTATRDKVQEQQAKWEDLVQLVAVREYKR